MRSGLVGALLVVLIAAGCGGGLSLDPVASAADQTLDRQTGRFEATLTETIPPLGRTTITGHGMFDVAEQAAAVTMDLPGIGTPDKSVELRTLYPIAYMRYEGLPLPQGKSWLKVDLQKEAARRGGTLPQLRLGGGSSPMDALAQLRGSKNAKEVGTDTIDGVTATHYRVHLDLDEAIARATPSQRKRLKEVIRLARRDGVELVPTHADVWVGDDGLVRRFNEKFGQIGAITMTFSDYGAPMHIDAPPPEETIDVTKLG